LQAVWYLRPVEHYQRSYFERTAYKDADHPAARIFVASRLRWFARRVRLGGARVLELGAGPGIFSAPLEREARQLVAVDAVRFQLAPNPARQRALADATRLPFADRAFDLVLVANLLHHVPDPIAVLFEARRVCREAVLLLEPNGRNPAQVVFSLLVPEERGGLRFSRAHVRRLAAAAGLEAETIAPFGALTQNRTPPWLARVLAPLDRPLPMGLFLIALLRPAAR